MSDPARMFAVVCGEQMSAKNRWSSSHTRVDPLGERFGDPSGQTVAWNASFCSSISRFMSSVRMPISCPLPVSISAHGIASRPRWLGVIEAYWRAINSTEELDLVTQDMLIGQSGQLEEFRWFVRAHLEAPDGSLTTGNAST